VSANSNTLIVHSNLFYSFVRFMCIIFFTKTLFKAPEEMVLPSIDTEKDELNTSKFSGLSMLLLNRFNISVRVEHSKKIHRHSNQVYFY